MAAISTINAVPRGASLAMALRSRRIDCEVLEGLAFCESPWSSLGAGITPGALCCRSGFPPIPAEAARNYPESLAVTVLLRPQVQNCLLTRLKLILADQMAFAIQRFPGSSLGASGGRLIGEGADLHSRPSAHQGVPNGCI